MPRAKKSRKPGQIGTAKSSTKSQAPKSTTPSKADKKKKNNKGRASGSRNSLLEQTSSTMSATRNVQDHRLGSKKKIDLLGANKKATSSQKSAEQKQLIPKFKTPLQELDFIENDKKLQGLLDKLESENRISEEEQHYVDTLLNRHKILCSLLGMDSEEEGDQAETSSDQSNDPDSLLDQLDKDFKF